MGGVLYVSGSEGETAGAAGSIGDRRWVKCPFPHAEKRPGPYVAAVAIA